MRHRSRLSPGDGSDEVTAWVGIVAGVGRRGGDLLFWLPSWGGLSGSYNHPSPAMAGPSNAVGPGDDGTRSDANQRLCRRVGGHGVDHAAEPAIGRPSRPDKSGRYSRLAVRYDAGPAASAHLGQSHPDAGPLRQQCLVVEQLDEVLVPASPRRRTSAISGWISQGPVDDRRDYGALKDHASLALADRGITTWLYRDSRLSDQDLEISTNTGLPVLSRTETAVRVRATPDRGPKWLDARTVVVYEKPTDIPHPTGADLVRYAAMFVNVPYLWGGRAGFGFDCSGFTSTIYQVYGITLPRDAGPQAADSRGRPVDDPGSWWPAICSTRTAAGTPRRRSTTWPCIPGTAR